MAQEMPYLELGGNPREDDLVCRFKVRPAAGVSIEEAANSIAAESSIGTWTNVEALTPQLRERLKARVLSISGGEVVIAYGAELFEADNMAEVYSSISGNIYGMKEVETLRLEEVSFPSVLVDSFPGPSLGIEGIRGALEIYDRPLVGTIVKPKIGLTPEKHAAVLYEAMVGGCDVVKDDENLTSQSFSPFEQRLDACLKAAARAEDETGSKKGYIPNVTASTGEMLRRAELVAKKGGRFAMVDIVTAGWSGVQELRKQELHLILHGHRAMHAAFTRLENHGVAMAVLARSARLAGIDQLHVGSAVGKMAGGREEVLRSVRALTSLPVEKGEMAAHQNWRDVKAAMPIASGGLHPGHVPEVFRIFGKNVIIQMGGGIHGHPSGTRAGAMAARQALDAALKGVALREAAKNASELAAALDKWMKAG